jgi:hypothetical protein
MARTVVSINVNPCSIATFPEINATYPCSSTFTLLRKVQLESVS